MILIAYLFHLIIDCIDMNGDDMAKKRVKRGQRVEVHAVQVGGGLLTSLQSSHLLTTDCQKVINDFSELYVPAGNVMLHPQREFGIPLML